MRRRPSRDTILWILVYLCSILSTLLFAHKLPESYFADTPSYVEAASSLANGEIDIFRTPGYPAVITLCRSIMPQYWTELIFALQIGLFYFSIYLFRTLAGRCIPHSSVAAWVMTFVYAVYPAFHIFAFFVATESLGILEVVLLMWLLERWLRKEGWGYYVGITLVSMSMVALRPSLLTIPLAMIATALVLVFSRRWRHKSLLLFLSAMIQFGVCVPYVLAIHRRINIYSVSIVSVINDYACWRLPGTLYPELFDDPKVAHIIAVNDSVNANEKPVPRNFYEVEAVAARIGWDGIASYNKRARAAHPDVYLQLIWGRCIESVSPPFSKNILYYALTLIYTVWLVCHMIRRRRVYGISLFMDIFSLGTIASVIIGAQADWARLIMPMAPAAFIMAGQLSGRVHKVCLKNVPRRSMRVSQ